MFDILSTAELTISASIVAAFLSLAMAETAREPRHRSGRARRMVCPCFGARRDGCAQSRGFGRAGARPRRRFAHRSARLGLFRSTLCAECDGHNALAGAHRPPCDPPARVHFHRSLRRGPPSRAVCAERWVGRYVHWRDRPAARLGGHAIRRAGATAGAFVERARGRRPRRRSHARALVGARSASGFRWPPRLLRR